MWETVSAIGSIEKAFKDSFIVYKFFLDKASRYHVGRLISTILILIEGEIEEFDGVVATDFTKCGFIQEPCLNCFGLFV